ncbi:polysaccharide biosynthesis protein, partial [Sulfurimonas sp. MAG313]|nr:polysaccharide biosynthesis protein [Sulfurimonas sp. MAG313]
MGRILKPTAFKRVLFFIAIDAFISLCTLYLAYALRFNFSVNQAYLEPFWRVYFTLFILKGSFFYYFKIYHSVWRFFSLHEASQLIKAHFFSYSIFFILFLLFSSIYSPFPRSVIIMDLFLSAVFIGFVRISKRALLKSTVASDLNKTIILGINDKSVSIIKSALNGDIDYYPSAIIAIKKENESSVNSYINSVKVYAYKNLESIIEEKGITSAILCVDMHSNDLKELYNRLHDAGVKEIKKVKILGSHSEKLEDLSIEELLARHPKDLDTKTIASFVKDKVVLITGAGGSIGSEIVRQCKDFGADKLILVDHSEYNLYQIGQEVPDASLNLLSVTNKDNLQAIFDKQKIDIVIHAAAYKHVPICEANIQSAIYNNIQGTKNLIDCAIASQVAKIVIISTDKAVRPTNVMGTTKRITELYAQNVDAKESEIVSVRFGNVLGSSGSVIPKFKQQIEEGGPITVTHKDMTRYFMMIPEACQLVLQAASIAKGGELFILDMGEPIKIVDLATQMIKLYNKENEIEIIYSGLRPGEKLYEELLIDESEKKT